MVTRKDLAERLERFEALAGLNYSEKAVEIWWSHLSNVNNERFNYCCDVVEVKIKWHILPTLNDFYKENEPKWRNI